MRTKKRQVTEHIKPTIDLIKQSREVKQSLTAKIEAFVNAISENCDAAQQKNMTNMKNILFAFLLLFSIGASAQTADYTLTGTNTTYIDADDEKAFIYPVLDTLDGTGAGDDTLKVTVPGVLGANYRIAFMGLVSDLTSGGNVVLKVYGAACPTCSYYETSVTATLTMGTADEYLASNIIYAPYIKLYFIEATGEVKMNGHIILKPEK